MPDDKPTITIAGETIEIKPNSVEFSEGYGTVTVVSGLDQLDAPELRKKVMSLMTEINRITARFEEYLGLIEAQHLARLELVEAQGRKRADMMFRAAKAEPNAD